MNLSDFLRDYERAEQARTMTKIRDAWFLHATLFRFIPIIRPPTRLERIMATAWLDLYEKTSGTGAGDCK